MTKAQTRDKTTRAVVEHKPGTVAETVDFMVAGTFAEGRHRHVAKAAVGDPVFLRREYDNVHDKNAIAVYLKTGALIGYMPKEEAKEVAPMIDAGARHDASIKKILTEGRTPTAVVFAYLYSSDTSPEIASSQKEIDARFAGGNWTGFGGFVAIAAVVLLFLGWIASMVN